MRPVRSRHVFDRFAQERLSEVYDTLVPERPWSTRRNHNDATSTDGMRASDGGGVLAGVEPRRVAEIIFPCSCSCVLMAR